MPENQQFTFHAKESSTFPRLDGENVEVYVIITVIAPFIFILSRQTDRLSVPVRRVCLFTKLHMIDSGTFKHPYSYKYEI